MFIFIFICIIVAIVVANRSEKLRPKAIEFLLWAIVPLGLFFVVRRVGYLKASLLSIISPPVFLIFLIIGLVAMIEGSYDGVPASIPYHTAADLKTITGVDFPDVHPVDSTYHDDFCIQETTIKFVPRRPLSKAFYSKLRQACAADPCCWNKEDDGYRYYILPERPINRPKGTHHRLVEVDGEMVRDWDGDFIEVFVPLKGDTIYVKDGWAR